MVKARPLNNDEGPKRCINHEGAFCAEHAKMVRSRTLGLALISIFKWAVPLVLVIMSGILGFVINSLERVEAKNKDVVGMQSDVHDTVHTIEMNLMRLFEYEGLKYIKPSESK